MPTTGKEVKGKTTKDQEVQRPRGLWMVQRNYGRIYNDNGVHRVNREPIK